MAPACFAPSLALDLRRAPLRPAVVSSTPFRLPTRATPIRSVPRMVWGPNMPVPDFTDWENQGAGLAFANLSGEGEADLITLHVDNPNELNAGYYRMAKGLTRTGDGTYSIASWGPFIRIPGWFSWENQGACVAVANISGEAGQPKKDLVALLMDNPVQDNRPYYTVGFGMDSDGRVTNGWSEMIPVDGDFGWESQGVGVDVASISSTTAKDLVVFYIDNPKERNAGYYRIGYDMGPDAKVRGGWSEPIEVPNWFSWENQGGGVAVYDTNGNGNLDIVVFFIDNPLERNKAFYTIGRDLNSSGRVTGGWSEMREIPDWFSWENQGGGVAISKIGANSNPTMGIYYIDNPRGQNDAYLRFGDDVL